MQNEILVSDLERTPIDQVLPNEMLNKIIEYTDGLTFSSLASTSKAFNELSRSFDLSVCNSLKYRAKQVFDTQLECPTGNFFKLMEIANRSPIGNVLLDFMYNYRYAMQKTDRFEYVFYPSGLYDTEDAVRLVKTNRSNDSTTYFLPFNNSQVQSYRIYNDSIALFLLDDHKIHVTYLKDEQAIDVGTLPGIEGVQGFTFSKNRDILYFLNSSNELQFINLRRTRNRLTYYSDDPILEKVKWVKDVAFEILRSIGTLTEAMIRDSKNRVIVHCVYYTGGFMVLSSIFLVNWVAISNFLTFGGLFVASAPLTVPLILTLFVSCYAMYKGQDCFYVPGERRFCLLNRF